MMRKLQQLLHREKPVPVLATQAGTEAVEGAQLSGRVGSVSLAEADKAVGDAVLAERERIAAINAVASPEQSEMRDKLIADGTPALSAVLALNADSKTRPKAAVPTVKELVQLLPVKEVAAEMLSMINAAAPPPTSTVAQAEKNVLEQYNEMKDPEASAKFYAQHKAEIDYLSNQKSKKEGK